LPQLVWIPQTSPSTATASAPVHDPPITGHVPIFAPESSRAASRQGKKQNIPVKGLKTIISLCHSNDALIRESLQQMSQRLTFLECQCEMCTSMGLETPEPTVYPPLSPPAWEDPWAWYHSANNNDDIQEESD
jgi:hypothetical protein